MREGPACAKEGTVAGKESEGIRGLAPARTGEKGTDRTEWKNV